MNDKKNQFLISDHESMVENLNRISDDLLKSYWHFLATIAALGTAYKYAYDYQLRIFVFICLVGNIIFWLIGEYTLSHGFLFRFIQTKLARIEKRYYSAIADPKIKDPSDISNFIDLNTNKLKKMDHFIPDQFVPIYWASIWLIIINTVFIIFLTIATESWWPILFLSLSSLALIWKLFTYYTFKIRKFLEDNCDFELLRVCV